MTRPASGFASHCRRALPVVVAACGLLSLAAGTSAQEFPAKPIKLINGFAAGGNVDVVGRIIGQKMAEGLGQAIIIESRPGAGTMIANAYVSGAEPDGYTLLLASGAFPTVAATARQLNYDPVDGFAWVSMAISYPLVATVHPSSPNRTLADLIAQARAKPTVLNFPSPGTGSAIHLAVELFSSMAGIQMTHVPFRGSNEAIVNLLGGRMDVAFDTLSLSVEHIRTGALRALAVTSRQPSKALPGVPVAADKLPGFEATSFTGIAAPKGTPAAIVDRLNAELRRVVGLPEIQARFEDFGGTPWATTPAQMREYVRDEIDKWKRVVRERGIQAN